MDPKMDKSEEETTFLFLLVLRLAAGSVLPMALKSAIELDLLHLIKKYRTGLGTGASASKLAAQPPTINPNAAGIIDRVLDSLPPIMSSLAPSIRCPTAEFEKTKKAFGKVSKRPEILSWPWDAAKHMKSAATSAKDFAWCI